MQISKMCTWNRKWWFQENTEGLQILSCSSLAHLPMKAMSEKERERKMESFCFALSAAKHVLLNEANEEVAASQISINSDFESFGLLVRQNVVLKTLSLLRIVL